MVGTTVATDTAIGADAASELLPRKGAGGRAFARSSPRQATLSAVNYHFGSKQQLYLERFATRTRASPGRRTWRACGDQIANRGRGGSSLRLVRDSSSTTSPERGPGWYAGDRRPPGGGGDVVEVLRPADKFCGACSEAHPQHDARSRPTSGIAASVGSLFSDGSGDRAMTGREAYDRVPRAAADYVAVQSVRRWDCPARQSGFASRG